MLVHVVDQLKIEPKTKVMVRGQTITVNGLDGLKPYEYKITAGSENGILKSIKDSFAQELKATQVGLKSLSRMRWEIQPMPVLKSKKNCRY